LVSARAFLPGTRTGMTPEKRYRTRIHIMCRSLGEPRARDLWACSLGSRACRACDRYQKSFDRIWIEALAYAWGDQAKDEGHLAYFIFLLSVPVVMCLWGQASEQLYSRGVTWQQFWGASSGSEGEKSAERNGPSGWLARSRFVRRSVI